MPQSPNSLPKNPLLTRWADDVDPSQPLPEYPRPQMMRENWQNLNGIWSYAVTQQNTPQPTDFSGEIVVPYPLESALSGVGRALESDECLWYRRNFNIEPGWLDDGHILLHFGAVDWRCQVSINRKRVGAHTGGYDPFSFDITNALQPGENEIIVSVEDPTDTQPIQRGKQVRKPGFIWYTAISGIWQTVWLEHVPETYIESLKITPDIDRSCVTVTAQIAHPASNLVLEISVFDGKEVVANASGRPDQPIEVALPNPKLWSPQTPHLYNLQVRLQSTQHEIDQLQSYFGMRKFSTERDSVGHLRFYLNNEPCFLYGPLDQGYWPDGIYTPPTDESMHWEIQFIKDAGFNMLRKHIKVEPARYYYHCDRAGVIVWQDMVSGGISPRPIWFFFAGLFKHLRDDRCYWRLGRGKAENRAQFRSEYQRMIDALYNVVSIAIWCPFNEGWGQFDAAQIANWIKTYDPTRLVDHASGWFDQGAGDFNSNHIYFKPLPEFDLDSNRALVLSEFGGYSLNMPEHAWNPHKDFGYKKFADVESLTQGYLNLIREQLIPQIQKGLSAAVYTQTTDVETEVNGFLTYDRSVIKMDLDAVRNVHQELFGASRSKIT